jgi:hypothetical protein
MTQADPELAYSCLQHVKVLVDRSPEVFVPEYKRFFLKWSDPDYMKAIKLEILSMLVTPANIDPIITEVVYATGESSTSVASLATTKIGDIASQLDPSARAPVFGHLITLIEKGTPKTLDAALHSIVQMLRKYPDTAAEVIPPLQKLICESHSSLESADAKISGLFILGEFGYTWPDAPYVLEDICENFENEESAQVRLQMLNTTAKMFFQRPAEMKKLLGTLLQKSIEEDEEDEEGPKKGDSQDVRDRALLYYRLLQGQIATAYKVICGQRAPIGEYAEADSTELKEAVFKEFNTLSVVYNKPALTFLLPYPEPGIDLNPPEPEPQEEEQVEMPPEADGTPVAPAPAPAGPPPPQITAAAAAVTQQKFGGIWGTVAGKKVSLQAAGNADAILAKLTPLGFKPLAKGNTPDGGCKMYIYCGFTDGTYGYVEMVISPTHSCAVTIKCEGDDSTKTEFLINGLKATIC